MGGRRFFIDSQAELLKVSEELGLVFGFGAVSTEDGEPYFDAGSLKSKRHEHVTEDALLKAATDFMLNGQRTSTDMHARDAANQPVRDGEIVFCFPLTAELAKRLDIKTKRTGLLIGMKPSPEVLKKFKDGDRRGFSIGGWLEDVEDVE